MSENYVALKNQRLDQMFDELLTKSPNPEQLWTIVRVCSHLSDRAWAEFIKTNPGKDELLQMMKEYNSRHVCSYPGRQIIARFPEHKILLAFVKDLGELAPEAAQKIIDTPENASLASLLGLTSDPEIARRAAEVLLARNPNQPELQSILIGKTDADQKKRAATILLKDEYLNNQLVASLIYHVPELVTEIWNKYKLTMDDHTFAALFEVEPHPSFREEAGRMMLERNTEFSPLFEVFKQFPKLREEVWVKFSAIELHDGWLEAIKREGPEFTGRIDPILVARQQTRSRNAEVVWHELLVVNASHSR